MNKLVSISGLAVCILGLWVAISAVSSFILYRNGQSAPQYTSLTRSLYSTYILRNRLQSITTLTHHTRAYLNNSEAYKAENDSLTMIVVIGESFSAFHSSLMGYEKKTNPRLQEYIDNENMIVFDNVVTIDDHTHGAIKSIFSLSDKGSNFDNTHLFPTCFKAAGYHTTLQSNQYFTGQGISFLSDENLSNLLFDSRNSHGYRYDGEMLDSLVLPPSIDNSLIICHLIGQHYTYSDRYPHQSHQKFKPEMYNGADKQREIKAHYDNATLYNDAIMSQLIKRVSDRNACLIYFSDHGEEIFEQGDYMGHGNAAHAKDLRYQIKVPLLIWASQKFQHKNHALWSNLKTKTSIPISIDDISHALIDIAGIKAKGFNPTRSFINDNYNSSKHRIVLNSIDYDAIQF